MPQLTIAQIASIIHDANRSYCAAIGDPSAVSWADAPQWQRESMIAGVSAMLDGSATTPREQHEAWLDYKLSEGWAFGPVKDPVAKTHPCLVAYDSLPDEQKRKDYLSRAIVGALTADMEAASPTFTGTITGGPPPSKFSADWPTNLVLDVTPETRVVFARPRSEGE